MAYKKRNFKKDQLLTAEDLNAMDDQIASNEESAKKANDDIKNKLDKSKIVQEKGNDETAVMSQAAATVEFDKLSEEIDDSINSKAHFSSDLFEVGAIYDTGENAELAVTIRSKEIMTFEQDIMLQVQDGWRYLISYYADDGFVQTGYLTSDEIIFAGTPFRLVIRKVSDLDSSVHFDSFVKAISYRYGSYMQDMINSLSADGAEPMGDLEHCRYTENGDKVKSMSWVGTRTKRRYDTDVIVYLPKAYVYSLIYYGEDGSVCEVNANTSEYTRVGKNTVFTINARLTSSLALTIKEVYEVLKVKKDFCKTGELYEAVGEFEYGRIDENGALVDSEWWGRSKIVHSYNRKTILTVTPGYVFTIMYYDSNHTFAGYTPSTDRDVVIPANTRFRVCVRKNPTAAATLIEYKNAVKVSDYILDEKPTYEWWEEIKGVGHAGCESLAPQNTMSAYKKAVEIGLKYIESDVRFTSDNIPVMLHSATIDATSNGTGAIAEMTYEQALQYDFGSYFSPEYTGEKIPTLRQFCEFCRATGTKPYIEIKTELTEEQANIIKDILIQTGIIEWVTFPVPSGRDTIWKVFAKPRMLFILFDDDIADMDKTIMKLKSYSVNRNVVACFYKLETMTENLCNLLVENGIPVHAGSSDSVDVALACPAAVTEFAGSVNFPEVLKQKAFPDKLSEEISDVKKHVTPKVTMIEPNGFAWENNPIRGKIYTDYKGKIVVDYDVSENAVDGKTYYVDPVNGRYDNDGLTPETPLKSMADAYSRNDISVMMLANGLYAIQHSLRDVIVKKDLSIIGMGDEVYVTSHSASEFTESSSYNNVYQSTRGLITGVVDMSVKDVYGDWMQYTQVSTIDNVTEVAGSYAHIGGVLYVHTVDNRIPDADLLLFAGGSNIAMSGGHTLYLENLKVIEGVNPLLVTDNGSGSHPKVYAKNCTFAYSAYQSGDAVSLQGVEIAVFQNCTAKHAKKDGFNYHALNGVVPKAIEIGCTAYGCGYATDNDDQGSTIHDGGKIIRVNGNYFGNRSGNIADESEGTQSWNIGCVSHESNGGSGGYNTNFFCYGGVKMWLDSCVGYGSEINCYVSDGGKIYTRFNRFSGAISYATQTDRIEEY